MDMDHATASAASREEAGDSARKHEKARESTEKKGEALPFARSELCAGHAAPAHGISNLTEANVDGALAFAPEPEAAARKPEATA
jgi:hypothetical protein